MSRRAGRVVRMAAPAVDECAGFAEFRFSISLLGEAFAPNFWCRNLQCQKADLCVVRLSYLRPRFQSIAGRRSPPLGSPFAIPTTWQPPLLPDPDLLSRSSLSLSQLPPEDARSDFSHPDHFAPDRAVLGSVLDPTSCPHYSTLQTT